MKILIIEDDEGIQNFLKQGFKYKQCIIDQAFDGLDGFKKLEKNKYDIAIIDLLLPKLDGTSLIQKARENGIKTPFIVLSALQDLSLKTQLLDVGIDDYMVKPFSFEELYARITAILRRIQNCPLTEHLKFADLELVPSQRIAKRSGKKISLRKKEYALLEYMMQHSNRVISREELMKNVWDYNAVLSSNTVDSHMYSLRRKIDSGQKTPLIKTIHGSGYMLIAD